MKLSVQTATRLTAFGAFLLLPGIAFAYIGPGAGLSVIGSILAFLAAIVVAIFGFLFFPIRRFLRNRKLKAEENADNPQQPAADAGTSPVESAVVVEQVKDSSQR